MIDESLVIRLFRADDKGETARLVSFVNSCYSLPGHWTDVSRFHNGSRISTEELLRDASEMSVFVAEDSNRNIVACIKTGLVNSSVVAKFSKPTGYFGLLAVHPDLQGRGLGSRLVRMSERYCSDKGAVEMVCLQIPLLQTRFVSHFVNVHRYLSSYRFLSVLTNMLC